jgi:hypothetical protein
VKFAFTLALDDFRSAKNTGIIARPRDTPTGVSFFISRASSGAAPVKKNPRSYLIYRLSGAGFVIPHGAAKICPR